ncbi:DUF4172 domain-containing protein [Poseidonibacter lekithochrous]|uniref:DUF4172 domain-containing protein n=1 Tax=Poseidonibacter TaxID=2321187 RepID=UPI001C092403|nr:MULTISPECIES: DUF4172 domain-containing protein [Poseidonibacter]MBU3014706.1 DUF4172 domain-containing protein [Poseidonibacter lekithochrous]MDO6828004.1 DUF4172 domain-containing protein [Poseidonibacter sp. 1_MG-2023]
MSPIKWTVLCIQLPLTFRTVFTNFELVSKRVEIWRIFIDTMKKQKWIWEYEEYPNFKYDKDILAPILRDIAYEQGKLKAFMLLYIVFIKLIQPNLI